MRLSELQKCVDIRKTWKQKAGENACFYVCYEKSFMVCNVIDIGV